MAEYTNPEHPEIIYNISPCYLITGKADMLERYTLDFAAGDPYAGHIPVEGKKMTKLTFEEIYTQYHQKVLSYVKARVNNISEAEDITSDVFVKVMSALDNYSSEKAQLSTRIYTIATNTIRDYFRKTAVRDKFRCDDSEVFLENVISDDCDYDEKLFEDASLELLAEALEQLSEQERNIIVLHYYKELTHKKIAEMLSLSHANVRYINHQALKKIRNYFKAKDFIY